MKTAGTFFISLFLILFLSDGAMGQGKDRLVSFRFEKVSLRSSLDSLMKWYPVSIVYLDQDVEGKSVSAECEGCGFTEALNSLLGGTALTWVMSGNQVVLRRRPADHAKILATVSGLVTDSLTGEWLAGASVLLEESGVEAGGSTRRWCTANMYGFYALRNVSPGQYRLTVSSVGFQSTSRPLVVREEESVRSDVGLYQREITLEEVMVEGRRTALTPVQGFSRGVYVRSTPSDRTEYLLDGARIYNPSHFGGVLSTFNGETLNDVQSLVGGLPPYYGGRIGGILDLSMRNGSSERIGGSAGAGSLGSHLALEGPLGERTTFLLSGRRGFPEPLVPRIDETGSPARLGLAEFTAKLAYRLSGSDRLFLSGYAGSDSYDNLVEGAGSRLSNNFSWGNSALNLRWIGIVTPSLFLHASAVYTRYEFSLQHLMTGGLPGVTALPLSSEYAIEDFSIRAHAEHYYDEEHTVRGGVELVHHGMRGSISEFSTRIGRMSLDGLSAWELSVYLQDQWQILPRVTAEIGARATNFTGAEGSFSSVDPRFSILVGLGEHTRLYSSLTSINQFLHPYRNSGVFLFYPSIFWYPSTEGVRPSTSVQVTLGVEAGNDEYLVSAEPYYRTTHNLHEFVLDTASASATDLTQNLLFGTGRSYGLELALRKRSGDVSGSIMYVLSWGTNQFAGLNGGEPFDPRLDRRHELQVSLSYRPAERWAFGLLCVIASDQSPSFDPFMANAALAFRGSDVAAAREYVDINGSRLPGFQRIELSGTHRFSLGGYQCLLTLRLLNSYGLVDPFVWQVRTASDPRLLWSATMEKLKIFPLYPMLGVVVKF